MDPTPTTSKAPNEGDTPPEKYIRTFEGDTDIVKKGGTPDLAPLGKPSPIKTYAGDFSQRVKDTDASATTILAAEQDASQVVTDNAPEKISHSTILYSIAGIALLIIGVVGVYIAYTRYTANNQPVTPSATVVAPIFVDEKEEIVATKREAILQAVTQSVARALAPQTVRLLYIDPATVDDNNIFTALQLPAPSVLIRNINSANSMTGVVSTGDEQSPFFIISVASYSDTFASMLSWEKTMPRDLAVFFPAYPQSPASTSTPPTAQPAFRDEVISNHDVRIYRDVEDRSIIVYGYWDRATLVIARDPSAFIEILERLRTARTQR